MTRSDPRGVTLDAERLERSISEHLTLSAGTHPDRVAVLGSRRSLTYSELDRRANQFARAVIDRRPSPRRPIAVLVDHDALLPAALIGVQRAGGFYLPLDAADPAERMVRVLEDSGAELIVADDSSRRIAAAMADRVGAQVLEIERSSEFSPAALDSPVDPSSMAVVFYTSGSSGRPKGVCHTHRSILSSPLWFAALHGVGAGDRLAVLFRANTIGSHITLWGGLASGATQCLFDVRHCGLAKLADWIDEQRITVYHSVPTLFRRLMQGPAHGRTFESPRVVRFGGEVVTRTEWNLWREGFGERCVLDSGLGSTEAGNVTRWVADRTDDFEGAVVPLGWPADRKRLKLVDPSGAEVGDGDPGEIVVGSRFHFTGYWNRPELTRRVLTDDPEVPGLRWFRTGDLARRRGDGTLLHLGRRDFQVKIRGHRVEPAEIEHVVRSLDGIDDVVVSTQQLGRGRSRLVAFLESSCARPYDRRTLHRKIRHHLPARMVPSVFATVRRLPTLPGGKIDRQAVIERFSADLDAGPAYVRPRTPVEETIAGIWERVLDIDRVGTEEDLFFDLGADSLAAVEILASTSEALGFHLPVSALFDGATVGSLAARIRAEGWAPPDELVLHAGGELPPLFGLCGAFGHALRLLLVGQRLSGRQPFWALQPPAMDWTTVDAETVEEMAAHYLRRIRAIRPHGPYRLMGTSIGGILAFEIACQLQAVGEEVDLLLLGDTTPPGLHQPGRDGPRTWLPDGARDRDPQVQAGIDVARQHVGAVDRYRPGRFEGTLTLLRCAGPTICGDADPRLKWAGHAARFDLLEVPGEHGQFHLEPQISAVVAAIESTLR